MQSAADGHGTRGRVETGSTVLECSDQELGDCEMTKGNRRQLLCVQILQRIQPAHLDDTTRIDPKGLNSKTGPPPANGSEGTNLGQPRKEGPNQWALDSKIEELEVLTTLSNTEGMDKTLLNTLQLLESSMQLL